MTIPRPEYPRPQFARPDWLCLNGEWQFEIDAGDSGLERGLLNRELAGRILVPFCPESALSGIGHLDFMNAVWYRRQVALPPQWAGRKVLLHFQAVDYDATVWVNGHEVGRHRGGFAPFTCDLSGVAQPGETITIVVRARDDHHSPQPRGKQIHRYYGPRGAHYVRTTGIWQTVWLEPVPEIALKRPRITPDVANSLFRLELPITGSRPGLRARAVLKDAAGVVCSAEVPADADLAPQLYLPIPPERRRLWSIGDPHLYDLEIALLDAGGRVIDRAESYAGLRGIAIDGKAIRINGEVVFQRLVLDQGYYPDGILTAPGDEALIRDIELSMAAGFNGARLHQKVFEERFHYWADRLGYLTWGESSSWGLDVKEPISARNFLGEWREIVMRDRNHPSIIAWTPFNETWDTGDRRQHNRLHIDAYELCRSLDPTRPVNDASGYSHARTDLWTVHTYEQDPAKLATQLALTDGKPWRNFPDREPEYEGQPYIVDEFGGIKWIPPDRRPFADNSWGYGQGPRSLDEFYTRLEGMLAALRSHPHITGFCYTQLTDVEQEQNGIYNYDRTEKFDMARIARIFRM